MMSQNTPNLLQMFPTAPFLGSGFTGVQQTTNAAGNNVLRFQINYGYLDGNHDDGGTGGTSYITVISINIDGFDKLFPGVSLSSLRGPDYISINFSASLGPSSMGIEFNLDRYGRLYYNLGPGIGHSFSISSLSATANWIEDDIKPTSDDLDKFLTGFSVTYSAGVGGAISVTKSANYSELAIGIGVSTPSIGVNFSWQDPSAYVDTFVKWNW